MVPFDSWDETYKKPFGAVEQNTPVFFKVKLERNLSAAAVRLRVSPDGMAPLYVDMQRISGDALTDIYFCAYALALPGLYWYDFELDTPLGKKFVVPAGGDGRGILAERPDSAWQLTVYCAGFDTPEWLKGGILYQIMPDRFANVGGLPGKIPDGRFLRGDWGGIPEYRGDEEGKYLNNTYFGGNLKGIESKLPYLKSLGVTALYLNPIFEAHSNHRYNTADYRAIDPMLGTEEDFKSLCAAAKKIGIRVILDGVFSHTGDDSRYFNRQGRYPEKGAFQSKDSPYFSWYDFKNWPEEYRCWWGYKTLPETNELNPDFLRFITGRDGVLEKWQEAGASGWRLDVADELPTGFIRELRKTVKSLDKDAAVIGEVWEDASRKSSYGERRPYLNGAELDSVMNYPFRQNILTFLKGGGALDFCNGVMSILEHYPKPCTDALMNLLGTHDTARIITELAGDSGEGRDREWKAKHALSGEQRHKGLRLVRLAAVLEYFLPGVPSVYFGDEAGFEGYEDPFNRRCYRWGEEDAELLSFYRKLGALRLSLPELKDGKFRCVAAGGRLLAFAREKNASSALCAINAGADTETLAIPTGGCLKMTLDAVKEDDRLTMGPESFAVLEYTPAETETKKSPVTGNC